MGEILYRPVINDGEHLLHSKSNPNNVKGLTRDSDNKNPNINDWEPVEVIDEREHLEYELKKLVHEEKMAVAQKKQSTADAVTSLLNLMNSVITFVAENPEVLEAVVLAGKRVEQGIISAKNRLVTVIQEKNKDSLPKAIHNHIKTSDNSVSVKKEREINSSINYDYKIERENMSMEDARELILGVLLDYISMKKKLNRLSNANVNNVERQELKMEDVVVQLDAIIKEYPALMDDSTSENILALLKMNADLQENEKIKEVLGIESLL